MESEWKQTTLGEVCEKIQTGPFGSQLHKSDYVAEGIPSIMPVNIGDNRITTDGIARISEEDSERLSRYLVKSGDVVYSRRGDVERRALIRDREDGWLCGTGCLRVRFDRDLVNPEYGAFQLGSPEAREWIVRHAIGATMPNLNTSILSAVPFLLPPLAEQKAIAYILGSLDDKIEMNRRMNTTLEGMAQALFKSWFVDFDPVLDNALAAGNPIPDALAERAATRRQALANGTANRRAAQPFPATFHLTEELGWIPQGWKAIPFKDFRTAKKDKVGDLDVPEYSSTNDGLFPRADRFKKQLSKSKSKNKLIHYGNLVFGMSRQVLNFGLMHQEIGSVSSAYHVYEIDQSKIFPEFVESYIRARPNYYFGILGSSSREGQSLSKSNFNITKMLIPPTEIQEEFQRLRLVLVTKQKANKSQSDNLANLRDTLLPKLISGELRLPDAEELAAEALA